MPETLNSYINLFVDNAIVENYRVIKKKYLDDVKPGKGSFMWCHVMEVREKDETWMELQNE